MVIIDVKNLTNLSTKRLQRETELRCPILEGVTTSRDFTCPAIIIMKGREPYNYI